MGDGAQKEFSGSSGGPKVLPIFWVALRTENTLPDVVERETKRRASFVGFFKGSRDTCYPLL